MLAMPQPRSAVTLAELSAGPPEVRPDTEPDVCFENAERAWLMRYGPGAARSRERLSGRRLCCVVTWCDVALAQNGSQPLQLGLHPVQLLGQRRATSSGLGPLLIPASTGSQQLLLLVA